MNGSLIPGVLCLSSRVVMDLTKKGVPRKKFIPHDKTLGTYLVSCKKDTVGQDVYAIIKHEGQGRIYPDGLLISIIGPVGEYNHEIEYLKYIHNIKWKKYHKVDINKYLTDLTPDRIDLRDKEIVSIDPEGCVDIDDALHIEFNNDNNTIIIGVHIADVSSYIPENSDIDKEIEKRCETVYLKNEQINMLPDIFATNLCSLNCDADKRTFSVIFTVDKITNNIVDIQFYKSLIRNKAAISYDKAEEIINDTTHTLHKSLFELYSFAKNNKYYNNKLPYDTHKMIEIYMIMANNAVAEFLAIRCPEQAIFRIQNNTNTDKYTNYQEMDKDYKKAYEYMKITNLERAIYVTGLNNDINHASLGIKFYTHFTSPIRRYADILVHRLLYNCITSIPNKIYDCRWINNMHKNIKDAERESYILDIIFDIYKNDAVLNTYGYVIGIDDNVINIYLPELGISSMAKLFSDKLKKVINYESKKKIKYTSSDDNIRIDYNDKYLMINILDRIDVKVVISMKATRIRKKLMIQFINPNPMEYIIF